jgi:hypothetical protein
MPTFEFTAPDGKTYSIDGPEGATKEQAFGILQQQLASAPAAPKVAAGQKLEPFEQEALRTAMGFRELQRSPPMALARGLKDIVDTGAELLASGYDKLRRRRSSAGHERSREG